MTWEGKWRREYHTVLKESSWRWVTEREQWNETKANAAGGKRSWNIGANE
ncbi:hypothetical protein HYD63_00850 [Mycoplasmopsis bovis]|nr:hypothetical protein HYD63_00850 [Mycoplasmopsis bovis]